MVQGLIPLACSTCGSRDLAWIQTGERTVSVIGVSADKATLVTRDDDWFVADSEFMVCNNCFAEDFVAFTEVVSVLEVNDR